MAMKSETRFRQKVRLDLSALRAGGQPLFFEAIQQKAIKGSPDYFLCANGHFIALELKDEAGTISAIQQVKLSEITGAGGLSLVGMPSNWPIVLKTIEFFLEVDEDDCKGTHDIEEETGDLPEEVIKTS